MLEEDNFTWHLPVSLKEKCYSCEIQTKPSQRRNLRVEGELSKTGKILNVEFVCFDCFRTLSTFHGNYIKKINKIKEEKAKLKSFLKRRNKRLSSNEGSCDRKRNEPKKILMMTKQYAFR